MSTSSQASSNDSLISRNNHLFQVFRSALSQSENHEAYSQVASRLSSWLDNPKAYYPDARPVIVELLEIAQNSLRRTANIPETVPFHVSGCSPESHLLVQGYQALVQTVLKWKEKFVEPHLLARIDALSLTIIQPQSQPTTADPKPSQSNTTPPLPSSSPVQTSPMNPEPPLPVTSPAVTSVPPLPTKTRRVVVKKKQSKSFLDMDLQHWKNKQAKQTHTSHELGSTNQTGDQTPPPKDPATTIKPPDDPPPSPEPALDPNTLISDGTDNRASPTPAANTESARQLRPPFDGRPVILDIIPGSNFCQNHTSEFDLPMEYVDLLVQWNRRYQIKDDITSALCLSFAVYSQPDSTAKLEEEAGASFDSVLSGDPIEWPTHGQLQLMLNGKKWVGLYPPSFETPDHLVDVGLDIKPGKNTFKFFHAENFENYIFALRLHTPTNTQLATWQAFWEKQLEWQRSLSHLSNAPFKLSPIDFSLNIKEDNS